MSEGSDSDRYDDPIDENDNALDYLRDSEWPLTTLASLVDEFQDSSEPNTQDLVLCDAELVGALKALKLDPEVVQPKLSMGREWRRLYTDAIVLRCLNVLIENSEQRAGDPSSPKEDSSKADSTTWEQAIRLLDQAIVLAGAPGERRLELVLSCISYIQYWHLPYQVSESNLSDAPERPTGPVLATSPVPAIDPAPPVSAFSRLAQHPFVLPGFAATWPAISCWTSREYLRSSGGRGRIVPIERGGDYRTDDWSVDLMPWDEFLESIKWGENAQTRESDEEHKVYLAQHSLFTQFPKLRADIEVPDYVYTEPGTCTFASSHYGGPPGNEEQLVINAWCGGQGANSPAHTDPYHNIYVQAVGYKLVWLAPPEATPGMYAFNSASPGENKPKTDRDPKREGMLGNTSSLDVFSLSQAEGNENSSHPAFKEHALPHAQSIMLGPGDALVIPPGWWHAMRGIGGGSFSVSFWF